MFEENNIETENVQQTEGLSGQVTSQVQMADAIVREVENPKISLSDQLFSYYHPDTHLCVDLKVIRHEPGRMPVGAMLPGIIIKLDEDQFTFLQKGTKKVPKTMRNPHVYEGARINVNINNNGALYPTFTHPRYTEDFNFQDFCREAAEELLLVASLIGKNSIE